MDDVANGRVEEVRASEWVSAAFSAGNASGRAGGAAQDASAMAGSDAVREGEAQATGMSAKVRGSEGGGRKRQGGGAGRRRRPRGAAEGRGGEECAVWTARQASHWERVEALLVAVLARYWGAAGSGECGVASGEDEAIASVRGKGEALRGAVGGGGGGGAGWPPGLPVELPAREMALKDLSAVIICLRRLQDSRFALERGPAGAGAATGGGSEDGEDGSGFDPASLHAAISRYLGQGARGTADDLDEDAMRD